MIGERIKRARGASGLSLRNLAEQVGVSHAMIKKYEDNQTMPSSDTLLRIAKTLNVRVEYFFRPASVTLDGIEYRKRADTPKRVDRKSTRLNSSHVAISYAVFCLKKKNLINFVVWTMTLILHLNYIY